MSLLIVILVILLFVIAGLRIANQYQRAFVFLPRAPCAPRLHDAQNA